MHRLLSRQLKKCFGTTEGLPADVLRFAEAVNDAYLQHDEGRAMLERSMELSSRELLERNTSLAAAEKKYRQIFEQSTEGIFQMCPAWQRVLSANPALANLMGYATPDDLTEVRDIGAQLSYDPAQRADAQVALQRDGRLSGFECQARRKDGVVIWLSVSIRPQRDASSGEVAWFEGTVHDITARKHAEIERKELQNRLVTASRQAGMAEVATGVLHNVGNVLNSINVSATLTSERVRTSKLENLGKAAELLEAHADDLVGFLRDGAGRQLPEYLGRLHRHLRDEQQAILVELGSLTEHVDHVKSIISTQQAYARTSGVNEMLSVQELVEDAIQLHAESWTRHQVELVRDFAPLPMVSADKHRIFQILVNLLANAHQALRDAPGPCRVTVGIGRCPHAPSRFYIAVADTGVGIEEGNFTRIFSHGFTTKADGHGFGLHSSALAASAMGGALGVHSDGPDTGATFTLELPFSGTRDQPSSQIRHNTPDPAITPSPSAAGRPASTT